MVFMVVEVLPILVTIQPNVLSCLSEEDFHVDEQEIILASHSTTSNYYTLPTAYSANVCMDSESPVQVDISYFHSVRTILVYMMPLNPTKITNKERVC